MATKTRDMTKPQFLRALDRHGIGRPKFMGYCEMPREKGMSLVSYRNAPRDTWRSRLAYLIQQKNRKAVR